MSDLVYAVPEFSGKNIPVIEAAKIMGKDQQFIRQGMIQGILPIGSDIVNIGLHFFLKNVRPTLPPATKHNTAVA